MSSKSKIVECASALVYEIAPKGDGGHFAPNWKRDVLGDTYACAKCWGFLRHWPAPVNVHLATVKHSAIFNPWWMHIFCVERSLAEIIRPHLPDAVWGQPYLAKDAEEVQSAEYRDDQFAPLQQYECFYAGRKSDVSTFGIRATDCKPEYCELCGQMFGGVWPQDAFILDVDWADRSAGLKNGKILLLSQSLYEQVAWKQLQPVTATPIPVVARKDLPAKVQKAHWGSVEKNTHSLAKAVSRSGTNKSSAIVRLIYNDTIELPPPTVDAAPAWKRRALAHWCCKECGRQRVSTAGQTDIHVVSMESDELPGVPDSPVVQLDGTRLMMYHRDIIRAIRNMKRDLQTVTATHMSGTELPYSAVVGLPRAQITATGDTPAPCTTCGLVSTVNGSGQLRATLASVGKHAVMQDPDGWLCLPEARLHRFQNAIGAPLAAQLSEEWVTVE